MAYKEDRTKYLKMDNSGKPEYMITRTVAQMTHRDLFLITVVSDNIVNYSSYMLPPANFLQEIL